MKFHKCKSELRDSLSNFSHSLEPSKLSYTTEKILDYLSFLPFSPNYNSIGSIRNHIMLASRPELTPNTLEEKEKQRKKCAERGEERGRERAMEETSRRDKRANHILYFDDYVRLNVTTLNAEPVVSQRAKLYSYSFFFPFFCCSLAAISFPSF